jgi:PAS domain S-box-containing protein
MGTSEKNSAYTILIVEDNHFTADFIECLLKDGGFTCLKAAGREQTLDFVSSGSVDLVLLDIIMPDCNGIDIAYQIKTRMGESFLPVILISALCTEKDKVAGLKYADDYLTKPFSGEELIARVKSLLRIRRLNIELSQSKKRYECLYENFPHFYLSIDEQRRITECNRSFCNTYKFTKTDVIGKSIYTFFLEDDRPILDDFFQHLEMTKMSSPHNRTFTLVVPESGNLLVKMNAVYMGNADSGLSIVIAMEDVTRRIQLQEEQKIARKQLYRSARLASIGTLASGVAHEMNNPLTAILGFSSALLDRVDNDGAVDPAELHEYLKIINLEALRCRDIVENLSRFANDQDAVQSSIPLNQCITDAINLVRARASKTSIAIVNDLHEKVMVKADANKLEQVFINVLSNAIEFCPQGSAVTIASAVSYDPSRFLSLKIVDNGPGIPSENLPKVFDPFFTTKEVGKGTGMGLAICHKIMEECNGSIDIASDEGHGTTVTLNFPLTDRNVDEKESIS